MTEAVLRITSDYLDKVVKTMKMIQNMERAQIIRPVRKIKVVGCANCPYMRAKNIDGTWIANCSHPSFPDNGCCQTPLLAEYINISKPDTIPNWCPLENDVEAVVITNPVSAFNN